MEPSSPGSIARQAVRGSAYRAASSATTLALGFVRASLMARALLPEQVGVATLALFYMSLATEISTIGLHNAFIHRKESDEDTRATYFTMNAILTGGGIVLLALAVPWIGAFYPQMPLLRPVLYAYAGVGLIRMLNRVPLAILDKTLEFRRQSLLNIASSLMMTLVGPWMAWNGFGVWAIVGEAATGAVTRSGILWIGYRTWRPRLGWSRETARWFWRFGASVWWSTNLNFLLRRFDDFWVGTALGRSPLGFYAKAYEFSGYPQRVVAAPILSVFFPTFAHLQEDRLRLSRAFYRATGLMIRLGGLFSLVLVLTAPEFVRLFLGVQWLPMVPTFQLMIVYALLDPLSTSARNLLMATGRPESVLRVRIVQVVFFIPAVIALSSWGGIEGAALAADGMALIGAVLLFRYTSSAVDYSHRAMWLWPIVVLAVAGGLTLGLRPVWAALGIRAAFLAKGAFISVTYLGLLWLLERDRLVAGGRIVWRQIRGGPEGDPS